MIHRLTSQAAVILVAGLMSMLAGPGRQAIAQPSRTGDEASLRRLMELYRERCRRDVDSLARSLDTLDDTIRRRVLSKGDDALGDTISFAWKQGGEARRLYARLLEVPLRYNEWARQEGLGAELSVPEEVALGNKPREAIRPLIAPLLGESGRTAWDNRDRDSATWRTSPSARFYEFLILLRWLSHGSAEAGPFDTTWLRRAVGADLVDAWNRQATADFPLLGGQYVFKAFPPAGRAEAPDHLKEVVAALAPERDASARYRPGALARRDALLIALLQLIAEDGAGDVAASWFSFACRRGPPFTALAPIEDAEATLVAREDRPGSLVEDLCNRVERKNPAAGRIVRDAIFWPQLSGITADGRPTTPMIPWTGYVEPNRVPTGPARPKPVAATLAATLTATEDISATLPAEFAWGETCKWIASKLKSEPLPGSAATLRVAVMNRTRWRIAFGAEELARVLGEQLGPGRGRIVPIAAKQAGPDIAVIVREVDSVRGEVTIELQRAGLPIGIRHVLVRTPWPAWFAIGPRWTAWDIILAGAAALAICIALGRGWASSRPGSRVGSNRVLGGLGLTLLGLSPALWPFLRDGALPLLSAGRGGLVVFEVQAGRGMPAEMKTFVATVCARTCRALSSQVVADDGDEAVDLRRLWHRRGTSPTGFSKVEDAARMVVNLRYEVRIDAMRIGQGRVVDATQADFQAMLEGPDAGNTGERALPGSLLGPLEEGVPLVVIIHDGDHGALVPPDVPLDRDRPVLGVWTPSPTRDPRRWTALDAQSRLERLERGCFVVLSPLRGADGPAGDALEKMADGSPIDGLDAACTRPSDLDALWEAQWKFRRPADLARLGAFAETAASRAMSIYRAAGPASSRTALRRSWNRLDWGWLAATVVILSLVLGARLPGLSTQTWRRALGEALVAVVLLAIGLSGIYLFALRNGGHWSLGLGLGDGVAVSYLALAAAAATAVAMALVAWGLERRLGTGFGELVRERRTLFGSSATKPRTDRAVGRLAGLLLLGLALACWSSEPVAAGGAWVPLLPPGERAGLIAGLALWAFGVALLGPLPYGRTSS